MLSCETIPRRVQTTAVGIGDGEFGVELTEGAEAPRKHQRQE